MSKKYLLILPLCLFLVACQEGRVKDNKPVEVKVPVPVYKELPIPEEPELEIDKYTEDQLLSFSDDRLSRIMEATIIQLKSAYNEVIELIKSTHIDNKNKKD